MQHEFANPLHNYVLGLLLALGLTFQVDKYDDHNEQQHATYSHPREICSLSPVGDRRDDH